MPSVTQPEVDQKPEQAKVTEKPAQPGVEEKPKPAEVTEKPAQAAASDKPKPDEKGENGKQTEDKYAGVKKTVKIIVFLAIAVAAGMLIQYCFFTPQMVAVSQVMQKDYTGELHGTGTINVAVLASVGAKVPGRIERRLVEEGDLIHPGQVIANLEDTD